jgi:hypothetical protein
LADSSPSAIDRTRQPGLAEVNSQPVPIAVIRYQATLSPIGFDLLKKLFGKKRERDLKENQGRIVLPEACWTRMEYEIDDLPGIAMVSPGFMGFEHGAISGRHLSLIIDFEEPVDNGMPAQEKPDVVDPFTVG